MLTRYVSRVYDHAFYVLYVLFAEFRRCTSACIRSEHHSIYMSDDVQLQLTIQRIRWWYGSCLYMFKGQHLHSEDVRMHAFDQDTNWMYMSDDVHLQSTTKESLVVRQLSVYVQRAQS